MIELTHANWVEDTGKPVKVYTDPTLIFSAFYMPENKCTVVVSTGGATIMVTETAEAVFKMKSAAQGRPIKENRNE